MTRFGSFELLCTNVPSYIWCNLFYRQLQNLNSSSSINLLPGLSSSPSFAPVGINPKCGIPKVSADLASLSAFLSSSSGPASKASSSINWGSGSSSGNVANIVACGLSIPVILAVLYFVQKRKTAVGRVEMRLLFLVYGLTLVFKILTTTSLLTQGTTSLIIFTSIHAGLVPTFFTILLFNAFVSIQFVDDRTVKSILPVCIVSLMLFAATTYISLDTALQITSVFAPSESNLEEVTKLRNIPLFVLTSIYPLLCALLYFVLMSWMVLRVLKEYKPFFLFLASAMLFVLSQLAWFLLGGAVCERTNAKIDSSFIATILETAAVMGLFLGWRSIANSPELQFNEPSGNSPRRLSGALHSYSNHDYGTFVGNANPIGATAKQSTLGLRPKYAQDFLWNEHEDFISISSAKSTETLPPVPRPPRNELYNKTASTMIRKNPHLFRITTPIDVDRFQNLLSTHPNKPFVKSICLALRHGFWPWAVTKNCNIPSIVDNSHTPLKEQAHIAFVREQCNLEISLGRFSPSFGTDLLPGMTSVPIGVAPKPHSTELRLVVDHTTGDFSPNSLIPKSEARAQFDTLKHLGKALIDARRRHGSNVELVVFKSTVSQAYRQLPMHPLWQLHQIVTINGQRHVDRCNNFGNCAAGRVWCNFFALVIWIATFEWQLLDLFHYIDECFTWDFLSEMDWYEPYQQRYPRKQVQLLRLFDYLGIPHEQPKQEWGRSLVIIGFDVDPNAMTFTLPFDSRRDLILAIREFAQPGLRHTLCDFSKLAGWIQWSFNVAPLLRPGLCRMYDKMSGKTDPFQLISVDESMRHELLWVANHLERSNGIHFLNSIDWDISDADVVLYTDASRTGLGIWCPGLKIGLYSLIPHPEPTRIFYYEALAVLSALDFAKDEGYRRIVIYSDNLNTVDMFNTLHMKPDYNSILITTSDILLEHDLQLRVLQIPGNKNVMADALSRQKFSLVRKSHPNPTLRTFQLPSLSNGS